MCDKQQWIVMLRPGFATTGNEAETLKEALAVEAVQLIELRVIAGRQMAIICTSTETVELLRQRHNDCLVIAEDSDLSILQPDNPKPTVW